MILTTRDRQTDRQTDKETEKERERERERDRSSRQLTLSYTQLDIEVNWSIDN